MSQLTEPSTSELPVEPDEETGHLQDDDASSSSNVAKESIMQISMIQPNHQRETIVVEPPASSSSKNERDRSLKSPSKVPTPFLMRHTATSTTSFSSSPGAMAIDGIGEPSLRPPATIPFDDDDDCHPDEYEYDEEVEMATAIAISDKELEEEYRSRIFETAVQAKVMEEVEQVPPPNRCVRGLGVLLMVLLVVAGVVLVVVLMPRSNDEVTTSPSLTDSPPAGTQTSPLDPSAPTVAPTTQLQAQMAEYFRTQSDDPRREQPGTPQYQAFQAVSSMPSLSQDDWFTAYRLMVLYESTQGDSWHNNTNWHSDAPLCTWYGVSCQETDDSNAAAIIVGLTLANNRLVGTLPWEVMQLPLESLELNSNALVDAIPSEMARMKQLTLLDISKNWLTGSVPVELCANQGTLQVDCEHVVCTCCSPDCTGVNISITMAPSVTPGTATLAPTVAGTIVNTVSATIQPEIIIVSTSTFPNNTPLATLPPDPSPVTSWVMPITIPVPADAPLQNSVDAPTLVSVPQSIPVPIPVQIPQPVYMEVQDPASDLQPAPVTVTIPVQVPVNVPIPAPVNVPVQVRVDAPRPVAQPVRVPVKAPVGAPVSAPWQVPVRAPRHVAQPVPIQVPIPTPVKLPLQVPVKSPQAAPQAVPEQIPLLAPQSVPVKVPVIAPQSAPTLPLVPTIIDPVVNANPTLPTTPLLPSLF